MLIRYFLKIFYISFTVFFLGLLCTLAFGDILVRLTLLPSFASIPKIIMLMVPIIAVLAVPMASSLATQTALGRLYENNEVLMLYYMPNARKKLLSAIAIFSLTLAVPFAYVVFDLGPKSHFKGKQFIVTLARDRLTQLEPGIFHNLLSRGVIYFEGKEVSSNYGIVYKNIFLSYWNKKGEKYVITGQTGLLGENTLHLEDGILETRSNGKHYIANFKETDISLDQLLDINKEENDKLSQNVKFLGMQQLGKIKEVSKPAYIEYHARVATVLWQLFLPFLALWAMLLWGEMGRNNLLFTIFCASFLFLLSYTIIGIARVLAVNNILMMFFFYIVPVLICFLSYLFSKKKL